METFLPTFRVSSPTKKTKLTCCPLRLEIILSTSKKRPLSTVRLLGFDSGQKSATEILFKSAKNPIDLFPRVRIFRVDAILLRGHALFRVSSQPMACKNFTSMSGRSIHSPILAPPTDVRDF